MFHKILIANRGEIACRVAATARRLGIATVAVYSDTDAQAAHVNACDEAVHIGASPARESYLQAERIVDAALACGAQAVHPGYGFLSENADFARACAERGLVFIGPPADAIAAMGHKASAKALMAARGIPVLPGYHGADQAADVLLAQARTLGFPLMIKACAGGGGRGMRVVRDEARFADALSACQREAAACFGDGGVLLERYIDRPRHVEVQVLADGHGRCLSLFERDCSMQRRHQKLVEESPAPGLSAALRQRMGEIAVSAARAVGYEGVGTVEFIVECDANGRPQDFYFMEMNTRLQVEHPVTELVTGLDLVEWQLRVAAGEVLTLRQESLVQTGHAIEVRLCAERPEKNFLPSTGVCRSLRFPQAARFTLPVAADGQPFVRVDSGIREGDSITPFYDALVAKLIVWAPSRADALRALGKALAQVEIEGVSTNAAFLGRLVAHPRFVAGELDTHLVESSLPMLVAAPEPLVVEATP